MATRPALPAAPDIAAPMIKSEYLPVKHSVVLNGAANAGAMSPAAMLGFTHMTWTQNTVTPHPASAAISVVGTATQPPSPVLQSRVTADGGTELRLQLHPANLGEVTVHIARVPAAAPVITVLAADPATLKLLQRDHAALHDALVKAGVLTASAHVAIAIKAAGAGSGAGSGPGGGQFSSFTGNAGFTGGQQRGQGSATPAPQYVAVPDAPIADSAALADPAPALPLATSLFITA
jgi:hypothetical protein